MSKTRLMWTLSRKTFLVDSEGICILRNAYFMKCNLVCKNLSAELTIDHLSRDQRDFMWLTMARCSCVAGVVTCQTCVFKQCRIPDQFYMIRSFWCSSIGIMSWIYVLLITEASNERETFPGRIFQLVKRSANQFIARAKRTFPVVT